MHMTLEADYAVRIVEFLAVHPERIDAKTISEKTNVTLRFTLKILRTLVADGI
ncbi:MAG: Rrf2 family transcriptional regulator, partial [Ruminococcus bromii]|nr:Rrf2 family transcriptional regulator [Ruminococcus bromii]